MTKEDKNRVPKGAFAKYMTYTFVPKYSNNVMGLVYVGAALLILIVGLRGLGSIASQLPIVPSIALDQATGKIHPNLVMFALVMEFCVLIALAMVTYFTPVEGHSAPAKPLTNHSPETIKAELEGLRAMTEVEMDMIETYVEKFDKIASKISTIQMNNVQAISGMKQTLKN